MIAPLAFAGLFVASGFMIVFVLLGLVASIFWLWMLIDALLHEPTPMEKLLWFCVIFFLHLLGAIIYFVVRRGHRVAS